MLKSRGFRMAESANLSNAQIESAMNLFDDTLIIIEDSDIDLVDDDEEPTSPRIASSSSIQARSEVVQVRPNYIRNRKEKSTEEEDQLILTLTRPYRLTSIDWGNVYSRERFPRWSNEQVRSRQRVFASPERR